MSKLVEYEKELTDAKAKLERVVAMKAELMSQEADLVRVVQGWEAIIGLERKQSGQSTLPTFPTLIVPTQIATDPRPPIEILGSDGDQEEADNKTQFVRDQILARLDVGTTPRDLKIAAKTHGLKHPVSWPYGPLQRLKKKGEIIKRRGKFYPTDAMQSNLTLVG